MYSEYLVTTLLYEDFVLSRDPFTTVTIYTVLGLLIACCCLITDTSCALRELIGKRIRLQCTTQEM